MKISEAQFEKHVYGRVRTKTMESTEDFDPRPLECRGQATTNLATFMEKVKGRNLGVSLLLDPSTQVWTEETAEAPTIISTDKLVKSVAAFKESLKLPTAELRRIEQETRDQSRSSLWFSQRKYRITASFFGEIFKRLPSTPPHHLVLRIIDPKPFNCAATEWGKTHEACALEAYRNHHRSRGNTDLVTSSAGFVISEENPFLGASPDGYVYDPSTLQSFGLVEIKCPYKYRAYTPTEASLKSDFFCEIVTQTNGDQMFQLKQNHSYYCQVQGQMAITDRTWCDFVVYTSKGIAVERIPFDKDFWKNELLPKLVDFFDNCVAPELVSPIHVLGMQVRDLCMSQ